MSERTSLFQRVFLSVFIYCYELFKMCCYLCVVLCDVYYGAYYAACYMLRAICCLVYVCSMLAMFVLSKHMIVY